MLRKVVSIGISSAYRITNESLEFGKKPVKKVLLVGCFLQPTKVMTKVNNKSLLIFINQKKHSTILRAKVQKLFYLKVKKVLNKYPALNININ